MRLPHSVSLESQILDYDESTSDKRHAWDALEK